jgi:hypothetical protein
MQSISGRLKHGTLLSAKVTNSFGIIAPILFVTIFTIEGWLRSGYEPASMFISELSLGPWGWIQIVNFLITGTLIFLFGRGLTAQLGGGKAAKFGPIALQIIGLSLVASGPFVTDPSVIFDQHSVHGAIHGIFGALVFSFAPISCFIFFRRFRNNPSWQQFAWWTLAVGTLLVVGIGFLKASQFPENSLFAWKGVVQRTILVSYMTWLLTFALRLFKRPV